MELIITKNEHIFARATDAEATEQDTFGLNIVNEEDIPAYPGTPVKGKEWKLDYVDGVLTWVLVDRPLTQEERLEVVEKEMEQQKNLWRVGEPVEVGDRRFYKELWYLCLQAHTTQADWAPDVTPALWQPMLL